MSDSEMEKKGEEVTAFLLLLTSSEKTEELIEKLREESMKEFVEEAWVIYGDWDLLIKVKVKNLPELTKIVMQLRRTEGIKKTNTLIALQS
ncbi:MAG: Lrp/AsnC family transcriptional regulator [Promethearchaeota archaeon]